MSTRAFKFLLRPKRAQRENLDRIRWGCCELYNAALQEKRDAYQRAGKSLSCAAQQAELTEAKTLRPDLGLIYAQVLQDVLKRLHRAFDGFFRRVKAGGNPGYPRFRSSSRYDSFTFPQVARKGEVRSGGVDLLPNGRLRVHGVPGELKVLWHREMAGRVKTATFKREADRWYVIFACDEVPVETRDATGKTCGIDVGLESFAVLDDGTLFENQRFYRHAEKKLANAQRRLSIKRRGSKRRDKARRLVARHHAHVANARRNHAHQTARKLVNEFDRIAVEQLNVLGMARGLFPKSVHDAGWAQFLTILGSKAEGAGCQIVKVNASGTSQVCSDCGTVVTKDLSVRVHRCPDCGYVANRDVNAARNIRMRAFGPDGAVGEGRWRPVEPRSPAL